MRDPILEEDLIFIKDHILSDKAFFNRTILITGATGLIGSLATKSILYANRKLNTNIKVLACVRNIVKAKNIFSEFSDDENLIFMDSDISNTHYMDKNIDFIIHTASITASKEMVENPTGVLLTAFETTKILLEYVKNVPQCKMVYISSMEYYGQISDGYDNVTEDKLGYIDLSKPRSCYPESKRVCEALCNAYASQFDLHISSARLAQTFGAGVPLSDNRVFAQFAKSAIKNQNILLHTTGQSEGNYCYTADAIYAIFLLLLKGEKGQSYNVARNHSTILNMAKMIAEKIANNNIQVEIKIPENLTAYGYAPDVKLKLNAEKLRSLGWQPSIDLENMFKRMIKSWEYSTGEI